MPRERQQRSGSKLTSSSAAAEQASRISGPDAATRDTLYAEAARLGINGRSRMRKHELREAIDSHRIDATAARTARTAGGGRR